MLLIDFSFDEQVSWKKLLLYINKKLVLPAFEKVMIKWIIFREV